MSCRALHAKVLDMMFHFPRPRGGRESQRHEAAWKQIWVFICSLGTMIWYCLSRSGDTPTELLLMPNTGFWLSRSELPFSIVANFFFFFYAYISYATKRKCFFFFRSSRKYKMHTNIYMNEYKHLSLSLVIFVLKKNTIKEGRKEGNYFLSGPVI